jgi:hypothetical protein
MTCQRCYFIIQWFGTENNLDFYTPSPFAKKSESVRNYVTSSYFGLFIANLDLIYTIRSHNNEVNIHINIVVCYYYYYYYYLLGLLQKECFAVFSHHQLFLRD